MRDTGGAVTPMADHIARFWKLLATEHVRILIDIRRDHDEGQPPHWDSASFSDDVAKALADQNAAQKGHLAKYVVRSMADAWDAPSNRTYEPVENLAAEIYAAFGYDGPGEKPKWVPGGNSLKQDLARYDARNALRAAGHSPAISSQDRQP